MKKASLSLSPSHFHRVFCRLIGIPPGEFLSALRFQVARLLLLTTPPTRENLQAYEETPHSGLPRR